ncbi:MAG: hypothetical protein ABW318_08140, partial [Vicinamibacterales bacterium]
LTTTDRAFSFVVSDRWLAGLLRTRVFPRILAFAMTRDRTRKLAFRTISQIGVRYPSSPLSQTLEGLPASAPRAGDRFPWLRLKFSPNGPAEGLFARFDDTRFNLIVIGQPLPATEPQSLGEQMLTHHVADDPANEKELARACIPKPSFYLLRPDGHVGLAGTRLEAGALTRYLAERIRLRIASAG